MQAAKQTESPYRIVAAAHPAGGWQIREGAELHDYTYATRHAAELAVRDFLRQDAEAAELAAEDPDDVDELADLREQIVEILDATREFVQAETGVVGLRHLLAELQNH